MIWKIGRYSLHFWSSTVFSLKLTIFFWTFEFQLSLIGLFFFLSNFFFTGDRPHECEICQKRFALACNLRAHMKTHEEPQPEKCLRCGQEYSITNGLVTLGCCHECFLGTQKLSLLTQSWKNDPIILCKSSSLFSFWLVMHIKLPLHSTVQWW